MQDGEFVGPETVAKCVTAELAYVVLLVWEKAKVGGSEDVTPIALRTTMTYGPKMAPGRWCICTEPP